MFTFVGNRNDMAGEVTENILGYLMGGKCDFILSQDAVGSEKKTMRKSTLYKSLDLMVWSKKPSFISLAVYMNLLVFLAVNPQLRQRWEQLCQSCWRFKMADRNDMAGGG